MGLHQKLDEIVAAIEGARSMPMSASCIVNRGEVLAMLDELRDQFPAQIAEAETVLRTRESVLDEGREEADRILEQARRERSKLVAKTEVVRAATEDADRIILEAQTETDRMRVEVDEYVDTKLAN